MMMCPRSRTRLIREAEASCSGVPPPFAHRWCPEGKSDRGGLVEPVEYQRFTDDLVAWAIREQTVIGLVAVGSTAAVTHAPDEWSDRSWPSLRPPTCLRSA